MRVIVCGSRYWTNSGTIRRRLYDIKRPFTLVHGDCEGADRIAAAWGKHTVGVTVEAYPADFKKLGHSAGVQRNQRMADIGADLCLAFPLTDSRGTWDMVRRAKSRGIKVEVIRGVKEEDPQLASKQLGRRGGS